MELLDQENNPEEQQVQMRPKKSNSTDERGSGEIFTTSKPKTLMTKRQFCVNLTGLCFCLIMFLPVIVSWTLVSFCAPQVAFVWSVHSNHAIAIKVSLKII